MTGSARPPNQQRAQVHSCHSRPVLDWSTEDATTKLNQPDKKGEREKQSTKQMWKIPDMMSL